MYSESCVYENEPVEVDFDAVLEATGDSALYQIGEASIWIPTAEVISVEGNVLLVDQAWARQHDLV